MHHHYIDRFAHLDSPIHHLDARAKIIAVVVYSVVLISVPKYQIASLVPYAVFPFFLLVIGQIPLGFVLKHILMVSPFIVCLAAFNPIWDGAPRPFAGTWVRGGWLVCGSIMIKFFLGMAALIGLSSTTRFSDLLVGLQKLRVPRVLVMQLSVLYRYLFVLIDEVMHIKRARDARLGGLAPVRLRVRAVGGMVGSLFIRTLQRAERIHQAMQARGFDGTVRALEGRPFGVVDAAFLAAALVYALTLRLAPLVLRSVA